MQETDDSSELADGSNAVTEILVAYFSCTGTTEKLAKYAADYLNADLYEIWPADPYTDEDLAYYTNERADQEQNDLDARPQINGQVEDMSKYQIVVIAYPIWHGQAPRIISTFLEKLCADSAEWKERKRFDSQTTESEIENWLDSIDIKPHNPKQKETDEVGVFDFESKSVLLNSGYSMPINGLGTYSLLDDTCVESV
ncbi:MAG TPA: aldo/keto reductase, partial [Lachnospiraceae bacterium]|nr:aldo/keto reductase [Lachnospiraceae bacterium]